LFLADQNFYQKNGVELIFGNPAVAKKVQDLYAMIDSSGICNFIIIGSPDANVFIIMPSTG
jgi:hypothetical protein